MELNEVIEKRRSVRKYRPQAVPAALVEQLMKQTFLAPSARNTRSTCLMPVADAQLLARMAEIRDYGSAFIKNAPLAIVVMGDTNKCADLWRENAAISATFLELAAVDAGLSCCWVHINDRPRLKAAPDGEQAADYLRTFLPIPENCKPLCAIVIGYSDFQPAALPETNDTERIIRIIE